MDAERAQAATKAPLTTAIVEQVSGAASAIQTAHTSIERLLSAMSERDDRDRSMRLRDIRTMLRACHDGLVEMFS